jgi:glucuronoarabinoxylan endo-1,4-beta-xylanase
MHRGGQDNFGISRMVEDVKMKNCIVKSLFLCGLISLTGCATTGTGKTEQSGKKWNVKSYGVYNFDPAVTYQTIDGFGAGYTWYSDWIFHGGESEKLFDLVFKDGGMNVLRLKNEYGYKEKSSAENGETYRKYYEAAVKRCGERGERPIILMCCWSPAAYLKSNNAIDGKGDATLAKDATGNYCYEAYARWWTDSIKYYKSLGLHIDYVSIQNEVDFTASYDGCRFDPDDSGKYASYAKAFVAVYDAFQKEFGKDAPELLAPETMSCKWENISPYIKAIQKINPESVSGIAHHLYVGVTGDEKTNTIDPSSGIMSFMTMNQYYPDMKKWQTEYYIGHAIQFSELINNCLVYERANSFIFWSGVWGSSNSTFETNDMIQFNWNGNMKVCAKYYAMRHFSQFIRPGYIRIKSNTNDSGVVSSAYIGQNGNKVAVVLINKTDESKGYQLEGNGYTISSLHAYQSVFGDEAESAQNCFIDIGQFDADGKIILPPKSVTTFDITGTVQQ